MKKVIYFDQIFNAGNNDNYGLEKKVLYAGLNTGNIVYVEALKEELHIEKVLPLSDEGMEHFNARDYIGVLPCANMIGLYDYGCTEKWCEIIKKIPFPVVLIGIGAQSTRECNTPEKLMKVLPEEKKRALREMFERVTSIGVRGDFTAECLELIGIKNYRVIGCPSLYHNMQAEWSELKQASGERCVMNLNTSGKMSTKLLELGMRCDASWVMQGMEEMPRTVYEGCSIDEAHLIRRFPKSSCKPHELEAYMRSKARMFFELPDWNAYMQENDFSFSFGSRFHGNIAAIRNGVPALWITHDSRTQELVDIFNLPYLHYDKLDEITRVEDLIEYCNYENFYKKYKLMYKRYVDFLAENEIAVNMPETF